MDETPLFSPSAQSPATSELPPLAQLVTSSVRQSVWAAAFGVLLLAGARAAVAQTGDHVSMSRSSKNAVTLAASTLNGAASKGGDNSGDLLRSAAAGARKNVVGGEEGRGEEEESEGAEEEAEMGRAYSRWVEKPASLSVPLRVVALRGTVASMWRKDFLQSQSPLAKLTVDARPSHAAIASDLLDPLPTTATPNAPSPSSAPSSAPSTGQKKARGKKGGTQPSLRSAAAADVVTVGDR
ncbi:unnamed protein product [Closterium sp. Yama58-4]|nr:unnamed protein product [Closterium sp. Yama58-4]